MPPIILNGIECYPVFINCANESTSCIREILMNSKFSSRQLYLLQWYPILFHEHYEQWKLFTFIKDNDANFRIITNHSGFVDYYGYGVTYTPNGNVYTFDCSSIELAMIMDDMTRFTPSQTLRSLTSSDLSSMELRDQLDYIWRNLYYCLSTIAVLQFWVENTLQILSGIHDFHRVNTEFLKSTRKSKYKFSVCSPGYPRREGKLYKPQIIRVAS